MRKILLIATAMFAGLALSAQPKFAYVNFSELVQLMPEADQARATMSASSKEAQETYQAMVNVFNTDYAEYEQKASTWSTAIRESKEKGLTDLQRRIQEFSQSIQQELQQQEQQLMAPIYQKAQETVNELAKAEGFTMVIDRSTALYLDEAQWTNLTIPARKVLGIPEDRTLESLQAELMAQQQTAVNAQ